METYIEEKEIHGKIYRYTPLIKSLKDISKEFLVKNQINSWVVNDIDEEELALLAQLPFLEKISFIGKYYDDLSILSKLPNIEDISIEGKIGTEIPFEYMTKVRDILLNYDKKTCKKFFTLYNLEYIRLYHYTENTATSFEVFTKLKDLEISFCRFTEFKAIERMKAIESFSMSYNPKITDISWIDKARTSLKILALKNCKKITNWDRISNLSYLEQIYIENCGDIPSLDFLLELPNLKIVYIIGDTSIKDHRIKHILDKESVQELHISMNKNYDITFEDIREKSSW